MTIGNVEFIMNNLWTFEDICNFDSYIYSEAEGVNPEFIKYCIHQGYYEEIEV